MKIAYIITRSDEIGGAHIHVHDLAAWLREKGHEVRVFVGGQGVFTEKLAHSGIPFTSLKYLKRPISPVNDILGVIEIAKRVKEFQPDIISIHSAKAGILARLACAATKRPCVFTAHGWSFTNGVAKLSSLFFRLLEKSLAPLSKCIITVCESDRELALNNGIGQPQKITTIHNGMPWLPTPQKNSEGGGLEGDTKLVMVARFERQKDQRTLLEAVALLKGLNWNLDFVGDGPLQNEMQELSETLGISDRVHFLGRRQDVPQLLAKADIFALITNWEGFPRSIIEAMRACLPAIATDVAGVSESVKHGETGYLIPPKDIEACAEYLRILIESAKHRRELGTKGRKYFEQHFTFDAMAVSTLALYQKLITE